MGCGWLCGGVGYGRVGWGAIILLKCLLKGKLQFLRWLQGGHNHG